MDSYTLTQYDALRAIIREWNKSKNRTFSDFGRHKLTEVLSRAVGEVTQGWADDNLLELLTTVGGTTQGIIDYWVDNAFPEAHWHTRVSENNTIQPHRSKCHGEDGHLSAAKYSLRMEIEDEWQFYQSAQDQEVDTPIDLEFKAILTALRAWMPWDSEAFEAAVTISAPNVTSKCVTSYTIYISDPCEETV